MAIDDRTTYLDLPKPSADNLLEEDVIRLRSFADDVDLALNLRPLASAVTSEIGNAVSGLAVASTVTTALSGKVPTSRTVSAGTGLTGGGDLTGNISLALTAGVIASLALADAAAPASRSIYTGAGLGGGGDLSANRTISPTWASQVEAEAGSSQVVVLNPLRGAQLVAALRPWASQVEAEAGSSATTAMTPQRTAQQIAAARPWASQVDAEAGTNAATVMTPQRTAQAITTLAPAIARTIRTASSGNILAADGGNMVKLTSDTVTVPAGQVIPAGQVVYIQGGKAGTAGLKLATGVTVRSRSEVGGALVATGPNGVMTVWEHTVVELVSCGSNLYITKGAVLASLS